MDPVAVKTVSNFKLSAEVATRASWLVIKLSFLHDSKKKMHITIAAKTDDKFFIKTNLH